MANYLSDRTGASIDQVLDNADAGNIGKSAVATVDKVSDITKTGFYRILNAALDPDNPEAQSYQQSIMVVFISSGVSQMLLQNKDGLNTTYAGALNNGVYTWQVLYHTGNTQGVRFGDILSTSSPINGLSLASGNPYTISTSVQSTTVATHYRFINGNGQVGSVQTSGTATAFNTSSDPRLKDFAEAPTDEAINEEFNKMFSCFRTFKWKTDPEGALVWGFDAHACIDAGTGIGSEGEGSRDSELGEVYETTPAVTETRVVMDSEGNPTSEVEEVVITEAVDKKVSPAGVDQAKAVPILLAKIEQLERRLSAANL